VRSPQKRVFVVLIILLLGGLTWALFQQDAILNLFRGEPYSEGKPLSHWERQLREGSRRERIEAMVRIQDVAPRAKSAVPALVAVVVENHDKNESDALTMLHFAAETLGEIGPEARSAISALKTAYQGTHLPGKRYIVDALAKIDADEAVRILKADLKADSWVLRERAAQELGKRPALARKAADDLRKAANDENAEVRQAAEAALRSASQ
jgi:hypothetical protein